MTFKKVKIHFMVSRNHCCKFYGKKSQSHQASNHDATQTAVAKAAAAAAGTSAAMWRWPAMAAPPRAQARAATSPAGSRHPESTSLFP